MDTLQINRQQLPALRFKTEDTKSAANDRALYNEDRQLVIDGLTEFFSSVECQALAQAKPESYAGVKAKIEKAVNDTNTGETFAEWRKEYAEKGAKFLAMSIAMAGPSRL